MPVESVQLERSVARSVSRRREVLAAYVFGSTATGRARADSDVDIAVLLDDSIRPARMLKYRLDLMADLGAALHRRDVDLVVLNEAPPLLAHRVLSRGTLLFERSRVARVRFQVRTAARYLDLVPMYETFIRYSKRRARARHPVG